MSEFRQETYGEWAKRTYMAEGRKIGLRQGELQVCRRLALRIGRRRFGPPDEALIVALMATEDLGRLERLLEQIFEATSWDEAFRRADAQAG